MNFLTCYSCSYYNSMVLHSHLISLYLREEFSQLPQRLLLSLRFFILRFSRPDVELKRHSILFESIKRRTFIQQIYFIGIPFVIIGMKRLDCVYGVDCSIFSHKKENEKENQRGDDFCSFLIIKADLQKLKTNIVSLFCAGTKLLLVK